MDCLLNLLPGHVRPSEYIEHRSDIHAYVALELDDLLHAYIDVPVNIGLEGARVSHDYAWEVQQFVDSFVDGPFTKLFVLPYDVGIRDQGFEAEVLPKRPRLNRQYVRVDYWEECGSL